MARTRIVEPSNSWSDRKSIDHTWLGAEGRLVAAAGIEAVGAQRDPAAAVRHLIGQRAFAAAFVVDLTEGIEGCADAGRPDGRELVVVGVGHRDGPDRVGRRGARGLEAQRIGDEALAGLQVDGLHPVALAGGHGEGPQVAPVAGQREVALVQGDGTAAAGMDHLEGRVGDVAGLGAGACDCSGDSSGMQPMNELGLPFSPLSRDGKDQ